MALARQLLGGNRENLEESPAAINEQETAVTGTDHPQTCPVLPLASKKCFGSSVPDTIPEHNEPPGLAGQGGETPGSVFHGEGECSPCAWFWKPQGCLRGAECGYCHLCPEGEVKLRKKAKLAAIRGSTPSSTPSSASRTPLAFVHTTSEATDVQEQGDIFGKVMTDHSEAQPKDRVPEPSIGSMMHGTGECKPCAWFWKAKGCQNGAECRHCHMCPEGEIRQRKWVSKKMKADALKDEEVTAVPPPLGLEPLKIDLRDFGQIAAAPGLDRADPVDHPKEPLKVDAAAPESQDAMADIALPPGLAAPCGIPSAGSVAHGSGMCKPCAWLWKPQGCQNGQECRHCHLCPEGELKARRKVKADTLRKDRQDGKTPLELSLADMLEHTPTMPEEMAGLTDPFMLGLDVSEGVSPCAGAGKLGDADTPAFVPSSSPPAKQVIPSKGSALHSSGLCRPCAWFWKPKGCENGAECRHCHLCPEDEIKNRRKAKNMMLQTDTGYPPMAMWSTPGMIPSSPVDHSVMMNMSFLGNEFYDAGLSAGESSASPASGEAAESPSSPSASPKVAIELATSLPLASAGSAAHATGKCSPCAWFWKSAGCANGAECAHCHLCPEDEIRNRKKLKENALRLGALAPKREGSDSRNNPRTVRIAPILLGA